MKRRLMEKMVFFIIISLCFITQGTAQQWAGSQNSTGPIYRTGPVGINNSTPGEMLDIGGRLRLGDALGTPQAGTIRWYSTNSDFEGYTGSGWKSLISKWSASGNNIVNNNTGHVQLGLSSNLGIGKMPESKLEIYSVDPGTSWLTGLQITAHYSADSPQDYKTYILQRNDGCYIRSSGGYNFMSGDGITNYMHISSSGNIGINTTAPTSKLELNGGVFINSESASIDLFKLATQSTENLPAIKMGVDGNASAILSMGYWTLPQGEESIGTIEQTISLNARGLSYIMGNISIGKGTITPDYSLDVAGKIRANEIVVNTSGADFVFDSDYDLRSLDEIESFINANKHLPDIPAAKEVQDNGLSLGEMQTKLLQKVEELTLYMIELKKENEILKIRLNELDKR